MSPTTARGLVCGRNRALLAVMGLLAVAAACTGQTKSATPSSCDDIVPVQFALTTSSLPTCTATSEDGEVWYVWSSAAFYICQRQHKDLGADQPQRSERCGPRDIR